MEVDKPKEDVSEKVQEVIVVKVDPIPIVKKERYATVVHFPHMKHDTMLEIVNDIKAKKPRRQMSREYDVSCYYLGRILKYFKDCQDVADIKNILDDIYIKNHVAKPINHAANYKKNKEYYKQYSARKYKERKAERAVEVVEFHKADQEILCG